jgi:Ca2+-binding RTX toxin-like protein
VSTTDFVEYDQYLKLTRGTAVNAISVLEARSVQLDRLGYAIDVVDSINKKALEVENTTETLERVLSIVEKIGPLRSLARPLKQVIGTLEARAEDIRIAAARLDNILNPVDALLLASDPVIAGAISTLQESVRQIDRVASGVADARQGLTATAAHLPASFQAPINEASNTIQPTLERADDIAAAINLLNALEGSFSASFNQVDLNIDRLLLLASQVNQLFSLIEPLFAPLNEIAKAIEPVEWALDASEAVFNSVVSPILDPILKATGVEALMQRITDKIGALLPNPDILVPFENVANSIAGALGGPLNSLVAAVEDFKDDTIGAIILGPVATTPGNASEFNVGDDDNPNQDPGTALSALGGNDILAGGAGNDALQGGSGNDILIGGRGDDTVNGGDGTDVLILLGNLNEFNVTFGVLQDGSTADTNTLVFDHVNPAQNRPTQGRDVVTNVEYISFLDITFLASDFQNFQRSGSTTTIPATLTGTPGRDILLGNIGRDTIIALDGNDYVDGGDGNDSINGGDGNDLIDGGRGNDSIDGGVGVDTVSYNNGGRVFIDLLGEAARRPETPTETLINVENLIGSGGRDRLFGDNKANIINGGNGNNIINGFGGDDTIFGGSVGKNQFAGGSGNDVLRGGGGGTIFVAGSGNDRYEAGSFIDLLWYGGGASATWLSPFEFASISAIIGAGKDPLSELGFLASEITGISPGRIEANQKTGQVQKFAANGASLGMDSIVDVLRIMGSTGNDILTGNDIDGGQLEGGGGDDLISGGLGTQRLSGGDGNDSIEVRAAAALGSGGDGDDIFHILSDAAPPSDGENVGTGNPDLLVLQTGIALDADGGAGTDTLDYSASAREWVVFLDQNRARGFLPGDDALDIADPRDEIVQLLFGFENVIGSSHDDILYGNNAVNVLRGGDGNDGLFARTNAPGAGADVLYGEDGDDQLWGSLSNDIMYGGEGDDLLSGADGGTGGGLDRLFGEDGDDTFIVVAGASGRFYGGEGIDLIDFANRTGSIAVDLATEVIVETLVGLLITNQYDSIENIRGSSFNDQLHGDGSANWISGRSGDDLVEGRDGSDVLQGDDGNDTLRGGNGSDFLLPGHGNNIVDGGDGIDTVSFSRFQSNGNAEAGLFELAGEVNGFVVADLEAGTAVFTMVNVVTPATFTNQLISIENLTGGDFNDVLRGNSANNVFNGGAGDDSLEGRGGNDVLSGAMGRDTMDGGAGNDRMSGGAGNDFYFVDSAGDIISELVNDGFDTVTTTRTTYVLPANVERVNYSGVAAFVGIGNNGHNRFSGNVGNDRFVDIAGGNDTISGGNGSDSMDFRGSSTGVVLNFITNVHGGAAAGDFYASVEKYFGSNTASDSMTGGGAGRFVFTGGGGNDTLTGANNIDNLLGQGGNDSLSGLGGVDSLDGGAGNDTMTGGAANDYFVFSAAGFGQDRISDFEDNLDKLKVHSSVATSIAAFSIAGNGSTNVVLTQLSSPTNTITLQSASAINITAADFLFY